MLANENVCVVKRALNAATGRYFSEVRRLLRDEVDAEGLPVYVVLGVAIDADDA